MLEENLTPRGEDLKNRVYKKGSPSWKIIKALKTKLPLIEELVSTACNVLSHKDEGIKYTDTKHLSKMLVSGFDHLNQWSQHCSLKLNNRDEECVEYLDRTLAELFPVEFNEAVWGKRLEEITLQESVVLVQGQFTNYNTSIIRGEEVALFKAQNNVCAVQPILRCLVTITLMRTHIDKKCSWFRNRKSKFDRIKSSIDDLISRLILTFVYLQKSITEGKDVVIFGSTLTPSTIQEATNEVDEEIKEEEEIEKEVIEEELEEEDQWKSDEGWRQALAPLTNNKNKAQMSEQEIKTYVAKLNSLFKKMPNKTNVSWKYYLNKKCPSCDKVVSKRKKRRCRASWVRHVTKFRCGKYAKLPQISQKYSKPTESLLEESLRIDVLEQLDDSLVDKLAEDMQKKACSQPSREAAEPIAGLERNIVPLAAASESARQIVPPKRARQDHTWLQDMQPGESPSVSGDEISIMLMIGRKGEQHEATNTFQHLYGRALDYAAAAPTQSPSLEKESKAKILILEKLVDNIKLKQNMLDSKIDNPKLVLHKLLLKALLEVRNVKFTKAFGTNENNKQVLKSLIACDEEIQNCVLNKCFFDLTYKNEKLSFFAKLYRWASNSMKPYRNLIRAGRGQSRPHAVVACVSGRAEVISRVSSSPSISDTFSLRETGFDDSIDVKGRSEFESEPPAKAMGQQDVPEKPREANLCTSDNIEEYMKVEENVNLNEEVVKVKGQEQAKEDLVDKQAEIMQHQKVLEKPQEANPCTSVNIEDEQAEIMHHQVVQEKPQEANSCISAVSEEVMHDQVNVNFNDLVVKGELQEQPKDGLLEKPTQAMQHQELHEKSGGGTLEATRRSVTLISRWPKEDMHEEDVKVDLQEEDVKVDLQEEKNYGLVDLPEETMHYQELPEKSQEPISCSGSGIDHQDLTIKEEVETITQEMKKNHEAATFSFSRGFSRCTTHNNRTPSTIKGKTGGSDGLPDLSERRKSVRKTKVTLEQEMQHNLERAIKYQKEDGVAIKDCGKKGRGVIATRLFAEGDFVLEYKGILTYESEAKINEKKYSQDRSKGCFNYYFDHKKKKFCIDATTETPCLGRLLNHSKRKPNLKPKIVEVDKVPHLIFLAKRNITKDEELEYDYGDRSTQALKDNPWLAL